MDPKLKKLFERLAKATDAAVKDAKATKLAIQKAGKAEEALETATKP